MPAQPEAPVFPSDFLLATGCDQNHFDLAIDLMRSIRDHGTSNIQIGFINFGAAETPDEILNRIDLHHRVPIDNAIQFRGYACAYYGVKPSIREIFPGFKKYIWLDSDCWVQNLVGLTNLLNACEHADVALHPECDPHYFRIMTPNDRSLAIYGSIYGRAVAERLVRYPMLNAGVFSAKADSRLWSAWREELLNLRNGRPEGGDIYFSDQIPLHKLVFENALSVFPLRAIDNWQLYAAVPLVNRGRLLCPTPPHEEINIVHLAGVTKDQVYRLSQTGEPFSFRYSDIRRVFHLQRA